MLELEKTYLVKKLPDDLKNYPFKEVVDIYIPEDSEHPSLRIRKNGDSYEITKKQPVKEGDASRQIEQTVVLTESEFQEFDSQLTGKRIRKLRYAYKGTVSKHRFSPKFTIFAWHLFKKACK